MWHAALKRHGAAKIASMGGDKTMMLTQIETESKHFSWGLEDKPFQGGPTLYCSINPTQSHMTNLSLKIAISAVSHVLGLIRIVIYSVAAIHASKLSASCV